MKFLNIFTAIVMMSSFAVYADETTTQTGTTPTTAAPATVATPNTTADTTPTGTGVTTTVETSTGKVMFTEEGDITITRAPEYETITSGDYQYYVNDQGDVSILRYTGAEEALVVPETIDGLTVTEIMQSAFADCYALTDLTLPKTLSGIDVLAFYGIRSLLNINIDSSNEKFTSENGILFNKDKTAILKFPAGRPDKTYTIPESVVFIGAGSFSIADELEEIIIPDKVYLIDKYAFAYCAGLSEVILPETMEYIYDYAFVGCKNLKKINLSDNIIAIYEGTFAQCGFNTFDIPSQIQEIGYGAFYECAVLSEVNFAENNQLQTILEKAFINCRLLKSIKLMGDAEIQDQAFGYVLNDANLPAKLNGFSIICQQGSYLDTYSQNNSFQVTYEGEPIIVTTTAPPLTVPSSPHQTIEKKDTGKNAFAVVIIVCSLLVLAIIVAAILGFKKKSIPNDEVSEEEYDEEIDDESGFTSEEDDDNEPVDNENANENDTENEKK
jgi:hypothetical protein